MTTSQLTGETARHDADLARAAGAGDRAAFAAIYDKYADRLHDFCVGMLRDREAAADCVQDAFLTAATRLGELREPERLRAWLYAIARNEALTRIRARRREQLTEEPPEMASAEPDLETLAARSELAELINDACGGLSDRDRTVLELAYRHGLDGPELAAALGVSHTNANTLMGRLRDTIERSLGALLVSRRTKADPSRCPQLAALLDQWDGKFTVLMRKRVARHIDDCPTCDSDRRRMVSPVALLGGVPVFIPAPAWLREKTLGGFRSAVAPPAAAPGAASGTHAAAMGGQSWWPPHNFDTSDLAGLGTTSDPTPHPGAGFTKAIGPETISPAKTIGPATATGPTCVTEPAKQVGPTKALGPQTAAGPTKQEGPAPNELAGAPTVGAPKSAPKFLGPPAAEPKILNTDSAQGHLGGRTLTGLLVALVLLAVGAIAVLGSILFGQIWPSTVPPSTQTPAPAATNVPTSSTPATVASTAAPPPSASATPVPPSYTTPTPTRAQVSTPPTATSATAVPPPETAAPTTSFPPPAPGITTPTGPATNPNNGSTTPAPPANRGVFGHFPANTGSQAPSGSASTGGSTRPTCSFAMHCPAGTGP